MNSIAIFGGSGGLGIAVAEILAEDYRLLIGYNKNEAKALELSERLNLKGFNTSVAAVDVRETQSVENFLALADSDTGTNLVGVVNAVGPSIPLKPLTDVSADEFQSIMSVDVFGAFNVLKGSARRLGVSGGGAIVQFLTTAVLRTLENDGMSGIPKTAIMGIVRQLAREAATSNVRVNAVAPGVIDAGIVHSSFTVDATAKSVIDMCLDRTPMPRLGQPIEVASLVRFLLSEDAGYVNGQIIGVDGGYSA